MVAHHDHEPNLCHPATQLISFKPSRRRLPPLKRPPLPGVMLARKRRSFHAMFGALIGFFVGSLVTSRVGIGVIDMVATRGRANDSCAPAPGSWPLPTDPIYQTNGDRSPKYDALNIIGMLDTSETLHNSGRTLVFVGVMTAQKYVNTRAVAVYDTWGRELPGRIAFFSSAVSESPANRPDLPLVRLRGVDDSYPPQKKSFLMLQYMWEHYGDRFEWFLRADDDVYVRPDKLEKLLRSVDSRKPQFIGQAGRGNQEEFGLLSLEYDENFCMGGPGVLLSRETLARVAPHIKYCLKNLYTTHEDVELGRCVQKFAGIPCTWSYEMQTILYHNSSGAEAFTGNLKQKEVHHAITLHPVKQHDHMYRVHNYMKALRIQDMQQEAISLHRDILSTMLQLGEKPEGARSYALGKDLPLFPARKRSFNYLGDTMMLGTQPSLNKFHPRSEAQVLHWDFISRSLYSDTNVNPRRRIESPLKEGMDDVIREVMDMINMYSKQRGRVIEFREILYGYHRVSPGYGADYILDMLLVYKKYRGRKMTVPVRRHVYLQQQFAGLEIRETVDGEEVKRPKVEDTEQFIEEEMLETKQPQSSFRDAFETGLLKIGESLPAILRPFSYNKKFSINDKLIHLILPLSGRFDAFQRFISNFEEVCLYRNEKVSLILVLFPSVKEESYNRSASLMEALQRKFPQVSFRVVLSRATFARAAALELGAGQCSDDALLFFVDVDMVFTRGTLERIRTNTIRGRQAYFPIVFSEFDPNVVTETSTRDRLPIGRDTGYWRQFGFGIASVYKSDLRRAGGFDTTIQGWGKEDVDLFDKFVAAARNVTVFRAADPNLIHVFHIVDCDPDLEPSQLQMCQGSRADTYGSVHQLARHIHSHPKILKFAKDRRTPYLPP